MTKILARRMSRNYDQRGEDSSEGRYHPVATSVSHPCVLMIGSPILEGQSRGTGEGKKRKIDGAATSVRRRTRTKEIRGLVESHVSRRSLAYTQKVYTELYMYASIRADIHTCTHTNIHTYIRTFTRTYIYYIFDISHCNRCVQNAQRLHPDNLYFINKG